MLAFRLRSLGPFAGQMLLASLAATVALLAVLGLGRSLTYEGGLFALVLYLATGGMAGGVTFFFVAYLLKVQEVRDLWQRGRTWLLASMRKQLGQRQRRSR